MIDIILLGTSALLPLPERALTEKTFVYLQPSGLCVL